MRQEGSPLPNEFFWINQLIELGQYGITMVSSYDQFAFLLGCTLVKVVRCDGASCTSLFELSKPLNGMVRVDPIRGFAICTSFLI